MWQKAAALLPPDLGVFDATELEQAFATKPTSMAVATPQTPRSGGGGREYVNLLDHKRATNAGIALARLGMPHGGGLGRAILSMDESKLPLHKASSLLAIVPTSEEAELLRAYDGDPSALGSTERYFAELITIPRLEARLRSWVVQMSFDAKVSDLQQRQQLLQGSLIALRECEPMHTALGALLALGNALNAGTARENASGFKLDASLAQIGTVRSGIGSTLLGFLARHIERSAPQLVGSLTIALPALAAACRLAPDSWSAEAAALRADVTAVEAALRDHRAAMGTSLGASEAHSIAASIVGMAAAASSTVAKGQPEGTPATASTGSAHDEQAIARLQAIARGKRTRKSMGPMGPVEPPPQDAFEPVMVRFLSMAQSRLAQLADAVTALSNEAAAVSAFYCEEDRSVVGAQALLERLHGFGSALVAAHEQQMSLLAAEEARNRPKLAPTPARSKPMGAVMGAENAPAPSTPASMSTPGAGGPSGSSTPRRPSRPPPSSPSARLQARLLSEIASEIAASTPGVAKTSEDSLRAIHEIEERAPEGGDSAASEGAPLKLRRTAEDGREARGPAPVSAELQALFERRQAGQRIARAARRSLGRAASGALLELPVSPGKRPCPTDGEP